jgi:hypothetical protein
VRVILDITILFGLDIGRTLHIIELFQKDLAQLERFWIVSCEGKNGKN